MASYKEASLIGSLLLIVAGILIIPYGLFSTSNPLLHRDTLMEEIIRSLIPQLSPYLQYISLFRDALNLYTGFFALVIGVIILLNYEMKDIIKILDYLGIAPVIFAFIFSFGLLIYSGHLNDLKTYLGDIVFTSTGFAGLLIIIARLVI
jgi:hypothetical protein